MQSRTEIRAERDAGPARFHGLREDLPSVAAIAVLYHPRPELLSRLIRSVASQVDKIFIIDNTPNRTEAMPRELEGCGCPLFYHANGMNKGLAGAQNIGIAYALRETYTHVLLLDQDSALPSGAVDDMLSAEASLLRAGKPVAAVGPLFDRRENRRPFARSPSPRVHRALVLHRA